MFALVRERLISRCPDSGTVQGVLLQAAVDVFFSVDGFDGNSNLGYRCIQSKQRMSNVVVNLTPFRLVASGCQPAFSWWSCVIIELFLNTRGSQDIARLDYFNLGYTPIGVIIWTSRTVPSTNGRYTSRTRRSSPWGRSICWRDVTWREDKIR